MLENNQDNEQRGSILVVDDNPINLKTLNIWLANDGYQVYLAQSGEEGIALAAQVFPDLILLDVMMPGIDGYETCRRIRANPVLSMIPIVMITTASNRQARIQGIEAGADEFITRPLDTTELRMRIRNITQLNRYKRIISEQSRFMWAIDSSETGFLLVNQDETIDYANNRACRWLETETCVSRSFRELITTHYQVQPPLPPDKSWLTGRDKRILLRPATDTADSLWLEIEVMRDDASEQQPFLVRLRDVSGAIDKDRLMWTFHHQIQHKFGHELMFLTMNLDLLGDGDCLPESEQQAMVEARNAAGQLSNSLEAIINYISLVQTPNVSNMNCTVSNLVETIGKIQQERKEQSINFSSAVSNPAEKLLPLDTQSFETILVELIVNAHKYHPTQSPVVDIWLTDGDDGSVTMVVEDNGVHVAPDQLQALMTPYYQADRGFAGNNPGMGLGLSMISATLMGVGAVCRPSNRDDQAGLRMTMTFPLVNLE